MHAFGHAGVPRCEGSISVSVWAWTNDAAGLLYTAEHAGPHDTGLPRGVHILTTKHTVYTSNAFS